MINQEITTEEAIIIAGKNKVNALEAVERAIEMRCDEILKVAGKGNFNHPLMTGFTELIRLGDKISALKNRVKEWHKLG